MKVTAADGVQVYELSAGKRLPHWISERKRRSLNKDPEISRRVEIIQDLEFPAGCGKIKMSEDGKYIIASGLHPPQVRCYELKETSMKFTRNLTADIVQFKILSDDYSKLAFLCDDRSIAIHAKFGAYYSFRIPKPGRDMCYNPGTCDLFFVGSSNEIYRFNLQQGRFMTNLVSQSEANEACDMSKAHGLFSCAGSNGNLECFDLRARSSVATFDVSMSLNQSGAGLSAVRFDQSGYHVGVGTDTGLVAIYDLRSSSPLIVKDHMYDARVVDIKFRRPTKTHSSSGFDIISADRKVCKIWKGSTGETITSIEPSAGNINDVLSNQDDGLIMLGLDAPKIQVYFIPLLGPAPKWCSYLEGLTEELHEDFKVNDTVSSTYDDFRFITKEDVNNLGLRHLLGTPVLRAYMHGFFIDNRLYHKARSLADPFAYDRYREDIVRAKLEDQRKSRISVARKVPKINAKLASRLIEDKEKTDLVDQDGDDIKKAANQKSLLDDDRFASLFKDERFKIDEFSEEYRILHPNAPLPVKTRHLSSDEEDSDLSEEETSDKDEEELQNKKSPKLYFAKSAKGDASLPLGLRVSEEGNKEKVGISRVRGSQELTYIPEKGNKGVGTSGGKSGGKRTRRRM